MPGDFQFPPLIGWKGMLKGFLGASLLVGGIANGWGIAVQAILIILGIIVLMDGVMVTGKCAFVVICLIAAVIAAAVTIVFSAAGLGAPYLVLILIMSLGLYYKMIAARLGRRQEPQPAQAGHHHEPAQAG